MVDFEWDPEKERENLKNHVVAFREAQSTFSDPLSLAIPDPDHSLDEERFLLMGMSAAGRLIVACHTERGDRIRIINARGAIRHERTQYESGA
jgi:uncharacterized protein